MLPWMEQDEIILFEKTIKDSKYYLEFGCGGSTVSAFQKSNAKIFTIDSSIEWINKVKNEIGETDRINYIYTNIGEVGDMGYPTNINDTEKWHIYYNSIKEIECDIDTILIDGRFRINCTLESIKKFPNAKIIIHDFFNRDKYFVLLDFIKCIEKIGTLGIFIAKTYEEILEEAIQKFKYELL